MAAVGKKESLGEYGSGWEWDKDYEETMHVFDQTRGFINNNGVIIPDDTPIRYDNDYSTIRYCTDNYEITNGEMLYSGSNMANQKSCKANVLNAGNLYPWTTSIVDKNSANIDNSICPKGWMLMVGSANIKSFYDLIEKTYGVVEDNDSNLITLPMSFTRNGYYLTLPVGQGMYGLYWSAISKSNDYAYVLYFHSYRLSTFHGGDFYKYYGMSVRCVSR